jgi:hypothetical protein
MNIFANIFRFLPLVQYVVAGVEQVHSDAPGATKQQLAKEALGLAVSTGEELGSVIPGGAPVVDAAGSVANVLIDQTVALFNALGMFTHKAAPVATTVVAAATTAAVGK